MSEKTEQQKPIQGIEKFMQQQEYKKLAPFVVNENSYADVKGSNFFTGLPFFEQPVSENTTLPGSRFTILTVLDRHGNKLPGGLVISATSSRDEMKHQKLIQGIEQFMQQREYKELTRKYKDVITNLLARETTDNPLIMQEYNRRRAGCSFVSDNSVPRRPVHNNSLAEQMAAFVTGPETTGTDISLLRNTRITNTFGNISPAIHNMT